MRTFAIVAVLLVLGSVFVGCRNEAPTSVDVNNPNFRVSADVDPITNAPVISDPGISKAPAALPPLSTLINFDALPASTNAFGAPDNPASILDTDLQSQGVHFGKAGVSVGVAVHDPGSFAPSSAPNSIVGLDQNGIMPDSGPGAFIGDIYITFVVPGTSNPGVTDAVAFTIGDGGGDVDEFQLRSYNVNGLLIDSQNVSGASRFSASINVAGIHRVEVDFLGTFGYSLDDLSFNTPVAPAQMALDIKPTSCPNPVNVKSQGVVPVAILAVGDFDVHDIDVSSILLEGVAPIRHNYADVAEPFDGDLCGCSTAGPDGFVDLTLKFKTQDLVAAIPWVEGLQELTLTGTLVDGTNFELKDCIILRGLDVTVRDFKRDNH